jgi:hypothetical protein
VPAVEQVGHAGQPFGLGESMLKVIAIGMDWVRDEVRLVSIAGEQHPVRGAGQPRAVDQAIVLHEPQEYTAKDPVCRRLGNLRIAPIAERFGSPPHLPRSVPFRAQARTYPRGLRMLPNVRLELPHQTAEIGQELMRVDHAALPR